MTVYKISKNALEPYVMAGISEGVRLPRGKTKKDCEILYENFLCMFGEAIDADIILTILESKNWDGKWQS